MTSFDKIKKVIPSFSISFFVISMLLGQLFIHDEQISNTERRLLKQFPVYNLERLLDGEFMDDFEEYTQDQFLLRDGFRGISSFASMYLLGKEEVHGLKLKDGYIIKNEYPVSESSVKYASDKFGFIYGKYLKDKDVKIYTSIIPDKNYFVSEEKTELSIDYSLFIKKYLLNNPYMNYISIMELLGLDDYYYTDSHWRQESLLPVADRLLKNMGCPVSAEFSDYEKIMAAENFHGVYYGQLALPVSTDRIFYLTNSTIENCTVTSFDTGLAKKSEMYELSKTESRDPYEMFLGGADALIVIENPSAETDKELVMFRDSYGSSIAPLMIAPYKKITMIDLRYISSAMLDEFVTFENQDVLFLYSVSMLNNSFSIK